MTIDPDIANINNSYCQGSVLATAGVWATFPLTLIDKYVNPITFENPIDNISATLIFRANFTVVTTLNLSWQMVPVV